MGIWKGMKWVAREGVGLGAIQRFRSLIFRSTGPRLPRLGGGGEIWRHFMDSATAAVQSFGPPWACRKVRGRAVGVWALVLAWIVPPLVLALLGFYRAFNRPKGLGVPPIVAGSPGS